MAVMQYIGARYVPLFYEGSNGAEWDPGVTYEPLTIVTYIGFSWTSKKQVPSSVGAPNLNPDYWVNTGNYNEQINALIEEINGYREEAIQSLTEVNEKVEEAENAKETVNVIDYGADRTGSAACDSAISEAINANPICTLYFPAGIYKITRPIRLTNDRFTKNYSIKLDHSACIIADSSFVGDYLIIVDGDNRIHDKYHTMITGGVFDCNSKCSGIHLDTTNCVRLFDFDIYNFTDIGVFIDSGSNNRSADVNMKNINIHGINKNDSWGIVNTGFDSSLTDIRIMNSCHGVDTSGSGNIMTRIHPLLASAMLPSYNPSAITDTIAFRLRNSNNTLINCVSDQFRICCKVTGAYYNAFHDFWGAWYSNELNGTVFSCDGTFNLMVYDSYFSAASGQNVTIIEDNGNAGGGFMANTRLNLSSLFTNNGRYNYYAVSSNMKVMSYTSDSTVFPAGMAVATLSIPVGHPNFRCLGVFNANPSNDNLIIAKAYAAINGQTAYVKVYNTTQNDITGNVTFNVLYERLVARDLA